MRILRNAPSARASLALLAVLALGSCGGKDRNVNDPSGGTPERVGPERAAGGPVDAFHDLLSPLWHSAEGEARTAATCEQIGEFAARAEAVRADAPPDSMDAAAYADRAGALVDAVAALRVECDT